MKERRVLELRKPKTEEGTGTISRSSSPLRPSRRPSSQPSPPGPPALSLSRSTRSDRRTRTSRTSRRRRTASGSSPRVSAPIRRIRRRPPARNASAAAAQSLLRRFRYISAVSCTSIIHIASARVNFENLTANHDIGAGTGSPTPSDANDAVANAASVSASPLRTLRELEHLLVPEQHERGVPLDDLVEPVARPRGWPCSPRPRRRPRRRALPRRSPTSAPTLCSGRTTGRGTSRTTGPRSGPWLRARGVGVGGELEREDDGRTRKGSGDGRSDERRVEEEGEAAPRSTTDSFFEDAHPACVWCSNVSSVRWITSAACAARGASSAIAATARTTRRIISSARIVRSRGGK